MFHCFVQLDDGQSDSGCAFVSGLKVLSKKGQVERIPSFIGVVEMVALVAADVDIGQADGPTYSRASFGVGHQDNGDLLIGVGLYGKGVGIVLFGFPEVDGTHIAPAAVEVKATGFCVSGKDEGVVAMELL